VEVAKVTSKGQITIPISIRRRLEINEGDKVLFIYKPEGVMMVNPNTMQGSYAADVVEASESELGAEAAAAMKEKEAAKRASKDKAPQETAAQPPAAASEPDPEPLYTGEPANKQTSEPARRPVPPPVEELLKQEKTVGGFDLSTLLDDIRSIGSNI